jgi:hypothetical protein
MISNVDVRRLGATVVVILAASAGLGAGACGNYSNEDLAYMSVVPVKQELAANLPQAQSAVQIAGAAELYRTTHNVTETLNGMLGNLLSLVEAVRHYSPSSRTAVSRTWGPYLSLEHPGWRVEMVIARDDVTPDDKFDYWFAFIPVLDPGAKPLHLIDGTFQIGGSLREGHGTLNITTAGARAAGIDVNLGFLDHMEIDYVVTGPTIAVTMSIADLSNPLKPDDVRMATYRYDSVEDGRGAMRFEFLANGVPGPATEKFAITSRWLGTGEGRGDVEVLEGDGAGAKQTECWDRQFQATYNLKPWAPAENVGDPSTCPDIPTTL